MTTFVIIVSTITVVLVLVVFDRLFLFLEDRGHLYYRKKTGSSSSLGTAFLGVQSMVDPSAKHVLELLQGEQEEQDESGDPPVPRFRQKSD